MSAVNKANPLRIDVLAAQQRFVGPLAVALVTLLAIHAAPKDIGYWMRRNMTLAYFAAALLLLFQLTAPLKRYLILLETWRFTGAPEPLSRAARSHALSLAQLVSAPACLGLAFIGSIAGLVLSRWFPALETLNGPMSAVWWISLIALGLFPIAGGFLFNEAFQKHRLLSQEVELNRGFAPRPLSELISGADDESVEALVRVDAQHFKAGGEVWSWDDFFKSCVVFGETGSGKTSCVLNSLLDGLLGTSTAGGMPPAALVLDPKAGYLDDVRELCRRHGRSSDLIVIDPLDFSAPRWNPLDSSDDSMELASRFAAVSRALGAKDASTTFWQTKSTMVIQNAIDLLRLTSRPDQPPSFARIHELVADPAYLEELLSHALALGRRETECVKFFSNEWRHMAPDQRSGVEGHLTNLLNPFLQAPYRTTIAGVSQVRVGTAIDAGKILYLKLSCADRGQMARVVGMFLKLEYYREVLKRPRKQRPSLFFCDEFQKYHTPGQQDGADAEQSDADAFRLTRESNHANLVATQNLGALGDPELAETMLVNCLTQIFLRNPDQKTNDYAASLFGKELIGVAGGAAAASHGRLRPFGGQQFSFNDQEHYRVAPDLFRELETCSKGQAMPHCDSLVFLGARGESPVQVRRRKWKRHSLAEKPAATTPPGAARGD